MKPKILFFLISFMLSAFTALADKIVQQADSAYNSAQYAQATALYKNILQEEGSSFQLLYNLGNACYQTGDFGGAVLYWERARKLAPHNNEINSNLRYILNRVDDANKAEQKGKKYLTSPDAPSFFENLNNFISQNNTSDFWAVLAALCFILFISATALYIFTRRVMLRKTGFFSGMILFFFSALFLIFSFMAYSAQNSKDKGVVMAFKVSLQTEPGQNDSGNDGHILTKGTVVKLVSEETDAEGNVTWYKIRLNSDYIGWIQASDIEII